MHATLELPEGGRSARLTPAELGKLDHPTPYLLMDLDAVEGAYRAITSALPEFAIHYATKCNPDPRILARPHAAGSGFEIAFSSPSNPGPRSGRPPRPACGGSPSTAPPS